MKRPLKAKVLEGRICCPVCKTMLGKVYYGGHAIGVELWCKTCHKPIIIEIK
jgi:uncharacterized protein YbaR (Trm112 family)